MTFQNSTIKQRCRWLLAIVLLLAIGCRNDGADPSAITAADEPVAAVNALADALADDDIVRFRQLSLPPALYAKEKAQWRDWIQQANAPTQEQAQDYADFMKALTEKDADQKLFKQLAPKLKTLEAELGMRWPLTVAMASGFAQATVTANKNLNDNEKAHASSVVSVLQQWANDDPAFAKADYAKKAIAVATKTTRKLDVPTLDKARELEMEPALQKVGVLSAGIKQILSVYGIDLNQALTGVSAKVIAQPDENTTEVEVSYPLRGQSINFQLTMLRRDGRWYPADTVHRTEQEQAAKEQQVAQSANSDKDDADNSASVQ